MCVCVHTQVYTGVHMPWCGELAKRWPQIGKHKFTDIIASFFRTKDFELLQEGNRKLLHFQQQRETDLPQKVTGSYAVFLKTGLCTVAST